MEGTIVRIFLGVVGIVITLVAGYVGFMWITYIDVTITVGSGYGLNIGETKVEAFQNAKKQFNSNDVYILFPLTKEYYGPHRKVHFNDEDFSILKERDVWELYFTDSYFDSLKLSFENDSLVSIHRHRQKFELP